MRSDGQGRGSRFKVVDNVLIERICRCNKE